MATAALSHRTVRPFFLLPLLALLLVGGCASLRNVDSDVSSYSHWPAGRTPATYAFERLPSQQAHADEQAQLEDAARGALAQAGFTEASDPASADASVQVSARVTQRDAYYDPWVGDPWHWRGSFWWGRGGWWGGPSLGLAYTTPRYDREVGLLIRDRKSGEVLYETRARNEGLSVADESLLAAMFEAALKDFPQPAVNPRRVTVPLASQP